MAVSCRHHLSACWRESAKHVGRAPGRQGGPPDPRRTPPSPLWTPPWTPPRPSPVDPLTLSCYPVLSGAICLSITIRYNLDRSHEQNPVQTRATAHHTPLTARVQKKLRVFSSSPNNLSIAPPTHGGGTTANLKAPPGEPSSGLPRRVAHRPGGESVRSR